MKSLLARVLQTPTHTRLTAQALLTLGCCRRLNNYSYTGGDAVFCP